MKAQWRQLKEDSNRQKRLTGLPRKLANGKNISYLPGLPLNAWKEVLRCQQWEEAQKSFNPVYGGAGVESAQTSVPFGFHRTLPTPVEEGL